MDAVGQIADAIHAASNRGAVLRIGTVAAVAADGRVQLNITGTAWLMNDADSEVVVGDRVYALLQGPTGVVAGKIGAASGTPVGTIAAYAGTSATLPTGWLLCDGAAVSRTTYALLFSRLSTTYGAGNGTTTFNLPNLANRFPLGSGTRSRNVTGGAETVTLTTSQIPAHDHGSAGGHTHTVDSGAGDTTVASGSGASVGSNATATTSSSGSHTHSSVGSGSSHENMPPFVVVHYIIRVT